MMKISSNKKIGRWSQNGSWKYPGRFRGLLMIYYKRMAHMLIILITSRYQNYENMVDNFSARVGLDI